MKLPDFLICGAQKSGTTSLMENLSFHPDICMPRRRVRPYGRELHFFNLKKRFDRGIKWYQKQFSHCNDEKILGEKTPAYMCDPEAAGRIASVIPEVHLIFILRDPVDRAYSAYWMLRRNGVEYRDFIDAVYAEDTKLLWRGKYVLHLRRFQQFFDEEQIFVTTLHRLEHNPDDVYISLCRFLGVPSDKMPSNRKEQHYRGGCHRSNVLAKLHSILRYNWDLNTTAELVNLFNIQGQFVEYFFDRKEKGYPPMGQENRQHLVNYFQTYNRALMEMYPHLNIEHWDEVEHDGE